MGSSPPQIGRASTGCRNGYAPSVMRFAPRPTPSCSNIPADIPSTPAPRPQPSSHSDPARHRPHRNPVRYVLHQRTTVRDWRMPRSATLCWGRPAGPTSALPIQTSAGGYGVNYDSPEAAPATKSGFGPPRLPQWTTDTSSAMACARPVARRRLRRGVPRASRVWKSARRLPGPVCNRQGCLGRSTAAPTWTPSHVAPRRAHARAIKPAVQSACCAMSPLAQSGPA